MDTTLVPDLERGQTRRIVAARVGMTALGLFWVAVGVASLPGPAPSTTQSQAAITIIAVLMFGNAAALLALGALLAPGRRLIFVSSLLVLGVNAILSITDEFGVLDAVSLLVSLALFALLIVARKALLSRVRPPAG